MWGLFFMRSKHIRLFIDGFLSIAKVSIYIRPAVYQCYAKTAKRCELKWLNIINQPCKGGVKDAAYAHEGRSYRKAFIQRKSFFESIDCPELKDEILAIGSINSQEAIILKNGGSIEFIAYSKASYLEELHRFINKSGYNLPKMVTLLGLARLTGFNRSIPLFLVIKKPPLNSGFNRTIDGWDEGIET